MFWSLFFGVALAVFAVFGFACAVQMIVDACFPLRQIMTVAEIKTEEDLELLEMLLRETKTGFFQWRAARQAVLLSESLCENGRISEDVMEILRKYGTDCYIIEPSD